VTQITFKNWVLIGSAQATDLDAIQGEYQGLRNGLDGICTRLGLRLDKPVDQSKSNFQTKIHSFMATAAKEVRCDLPLQLLCLSVGQ
jgi:hypothetical protein